MSHSTEPRRPPQPRYGSAFNLSIRADDVIIAYSPASSKYHLVRVSEVAYEEDSRQGKKHDKYDWYHDYSDCYGGLALCGHDGARTTWGNRSGYYWQIREKSLAELLGDEVPCKKCWALLKRSKKGEHPIVVRQPHDDAQEYDPPFGWLELPPQQHPYDVAPDADPELVVDKSGEVQGERRTELRRWQRGHRIVRVVNRYAEDRHEVLVMDADSPTDEDWKFRGTPAQVRRKAQQIMAEGGR